MRDKGFSFVRPILEELIKTEETYVENLWIGINNYGKIFERTDLPVGLRGKKYVLFGNIEQIAEFHRDELLPMFHRNKHDLKRLFDEFIQYVDVSSSAFKRKLNVLVNIFFFLKYSRTIIFMATYCLP